MAWRSFREGGVAVGAVVTDPGGGVLSRGRNQRFAAQTDAAVTGLLGHAELNALITGLPPQKVRQRDAILYTTLQPCPLCLGAVVIARLGRLRFAATDPTWAGVERLPELNPEVLARWPVVEGPLLGPVGVWAAILPVLNTSGSLLRALEASSPSRAALANPVALALATGWPPNTALEALDRVWDLLTDAHG